jgi:hypothetical protein
MKAIPAAFAALLSLAVAAGDGAAAQSKSQRCSDYAHQMTQNTATTTGPLRGAARGAIVGGIAGNAGTGAAIGAGLGTTRKVVQKNRSYQYYYDNCMRN